MRPSQGAAAIVDVTPENLGDLIAQSNTVPLLLDFWADWCEPCQALMPIVERLADAYQGRFILGKVNADDQPFIARQLGVRSLPTLKLIKEGQLVGELLGAQTEQAIRTFLDPHVAAPEASADSEGDALEAQVERARRMKAYPLALQALDEAIQKNPKHYLYQKLLAFVLIDQGDLDGAAHVVENLPEEDPHRLSAAAKLQFARQVTVAHPIDELLDQLEQAQARFDHLFADHAPESDVERCKNEIADLLYTLGVLSVMSDDYSTAFDYFIRILSEFPNFRDGVGKASLLSLFDILGRDDVLSKQYRRKMFTLLH